MPLMSNFSYCGVALQPEQLGPADDERGIQPWGTALGRVRSSVIDRLWPVAVGFSMSASGRKRT